MNIPRTMSTQHPDNVRAPFFAANHVLAGDDEIKEAFYAYSNLKIKEQLWDFEGKDVDSSVVRKLLSKYESFFREKQLGKDMRLTYRVPNPDVSGKEGKILLETLESIPRSTDIARAFYGDDVAPIFEVTVPMITNAKSIIRINEYYKRFVVGKERKSLFEGDEPISSWIGEFFPKNVNVIPLIEDKTSMLNAANIVEEFVNHEKIQDYQRVWLARSDPALNYGSASAVLIEKVALQRLHHLSEKLSLPIHPMLGCGSAPFRGNFKPTNVGMNLKAYPSVRTFTLQSAFKYDYEESLVKKAVQEIEDTPVRAPLVVDEEKVLPIIDKIGEAYVKQIAVLAPLINEFSAFIPSRRKRKLHIGLFGYSRSSGGVSLPRAIKFGATLYSLGLPPDLLGLHVLDGKDVDVINEAYPSFFSDLREGCQFVNTDNFRMFPESIQEQVCKAMELVDVAVHEDHKRVSSLISENFRHRKPGVTDLVERAGWMRGFLG